MGLEHSIILGYGIVAMILILAASVFETGNKQFLPLRLLLLLIGLFIMIKIPSTLNHLIYANDAVNVGVLNSTQVADLIRSNGTLSSILVKLPYIIGVYLFVWYFAIRFVKDSGDAYNDEAKKWPRVGGKKW